MVQIFSISNVTVLFQHSQGYYYCFKTYETCNQVRAQLLLARPAA